MRAEDLYPEYAKQEQEFGYFYGPSDYQPIIDSIGEILIQVDDNDYQGDTRVLYKKDNQYGYLIFGWGSCSGCDSLQSCEKIEEIQRVIDGLIADVKWFGSLEELQKHFSERDWELQYSWHQQETKDFINQVLNLTTKTE